MQLETLDEMRANFERAALLERLELCGWNETMAAETLGICRSQLRNLRQKHGLSRPSPARPMVRTALRGNW